MDKRTTETIKGVQFSVYRGPQEIDLEVPKFSRGFFITVILIFVYAVLLLYFGSQQMLRGNPRIVQYFGGAFLLVPYLVMIGTVIWSGLRKPKSVEPPPQPRDVPKDALFAGCRIAWSTQTSLSDRGWVWVEKGQLVFRGDRYDWRLNAKDVPGIRPIKRFEQRQLRLPRGLPRGVLTLAPNDKSAFSKLLAQWREAAPVGGESKFSPLGLPMKKLNPGIMWGRVVVFAAVFGLLVGMFVAVLPIDSYEVRPGMPFVAGLCTFAMVMTFPLLLLTTNSSYKSHAKLVEKLRRGG